MGDFDFDKDEEPAEREDRKGRSGGSARSGYSAAARRMPGRASLSIGGFVTLAGGLLGLISMLLPAGGIFGQNVGVNEVVGTRVWLWSIGALAVGGGFLRVRTVRFPSAGDYLLAGLGVLLALVFGGFQAISGYAIIDRLGLKGAGTYGLILAGALTIFGAVIRCIEQVRRLGKNEEADEKDEDEEDERPRRKRRDHDDEEEDEDDERSRRRSKRDEEEEEEPKPKPKPKPKAKPKPPTEPMDLPDE